MTARVELYTALAGRNEMRPEDSEGLLQAYEDELMHAVAREGLRSDTSPEFRRGVDRALFALRSLMEHSGRRR